VFCRSGLIERLGGGRDSVDVRVISATTKITTLVRTRRFREDRLYDIAHEVRIDVRNLSEERKRRRRTLVMVNQPASAISARV